MKKVHPEMPYSWEYGARHGEFHRGSCCEAWSFLESW